MPSAAASTSAIQPAGTSPSRLAWETRQNRRSPILPPRTSSRAWSAKASAATAVWKNSLRPVTPALRSMGISGYHVHMPDYRAMETKIQQMLGTTRRPVAVAFLDAPPAGVTRFTGSEPSSCSFWRLAAEGRAFYTVPSDHFNCPVGSYAHNTLTAERMPELQQTLALMSDIGYIRMEEIPGVFQLPVKPQVVLYAPLGDTPVAPSVVLAAAKPGRIMMLA